MMKKVKNAVNLVRNMGWRYVKFRASHEVMRRSGLMKKKFPVKPPKAPAVTLDEWKRWAGVFFFESKEKLNIPRNPSESLKHRFEEYKQGKLLLFNSILTDLGPQYDWVTNPDTGHRYDANQHWTEIVDYSQEAGDIKYVWEKSRFSFIHDIIRYDYHHEQDCSKMVFDEIISWIKGNPINCGPNFRCSQEISLRLLNWSFALYYYKHSPSLTPDIFQQIQESIFWQLHHVYHNIHFSRIAVRNNHAITETLALYLMSLLFPYIPEFRIWGKAGKKWFEQEIAYQVYEDGTFLQFSMNYHRVVVQLLTWALRISGLNHDKLDPVVHDRAEKSLKFLRVCMDDSTGWLPNYGANDGALFFKLNDSHYRDYQPQLKALAQVLNIDASIPGDQEDLFWYGVTNKPTSALDLSSPIYSFEKGGYYVIREDQTLTFLRCGDHKDRPSQADNLHLDVWYKGENILQDAGSYKYNADDATLKYFMGTPSHNTVSLNGHDQMLKGSRFIWYNWTQSETASVKETDTEFIFEGTIKAFNYIDSRIKHTRTVTKLKGQPVWKIHDQISPVPDGTPVSQWWHLPLSPQHKVSISANDGRGLPLHKAGQEGWNSPLYGFKEKNKQFLIESSTPEIFTLIKIDA